MRYCSKLFLFLVIGISLCLAEGKGFGNYIDVVIDWDEAKVSLTIDDVPCPETEIILDILHEEKVQATFFVVGELALKYPSILMRIVSEGHEVENHTMTHPLWLSNKPAFQIFDEVRLCSEVIEEVTGNRPKFFRPPQGIVNEDIESASHDNGLALCLWSRGADCRLWMPVANGLEPVDGLFENAVLLFHGGESNYYGEPKRRNDTEETIRYLQPLIRKLKAAGFRFVRLDEMEEEDLPVY